MKNILLTTILVASFGATSAYANEVFADNAVTSPLPSVSTEALENLQNCLQSDTQTASSKAIRACTKAFKSSVPNYDIRSAILTRRGLLQLSNGRFEKASRDFKAAAKLNNENEFAYLGDGYAALLNKDYASAAKFFEDCKTDDQAAPLAIYGLAMTKELTGDLEGAVYAYQQAAKMRPDWQAPRAELKRMNAAS